MKTIYFVRHGETNSNKNNIVQGLDDELSKEGIEQAKIIANRAKQLDFEVLIASDAVRARQTADEVAKATGKEVKYNELLREIRRPASITGKSRSTKEYKFFLAEEHEHYGELGWRFEDGENFEDVSNRVEGIFSYVEDLEADTVLMVGHGNILRHMVSYVLLQKRCVPEVVLSLGATLDAVNTSISVFKQCKDVWQLHMWNDHSHFG